MTRFDDKYRLNKDDILGVGAYSKVYKGYLRPTTTTCSRDRNNSSSSCRCTRQEQEQQHYNNKYRSYAIKRVHRKQLSLIDEQALLSEVSILRQVLTDHANVVKLHDFFADEEEGGEHPDRGYYYLVMDRMHGGTLFERINAKSYYSESEARKTCQYVLRAVQYCHEHRIAHRDLKPENLLLLTEHDDCFVKIADFGFAKHVRSPNSLMTKCGTPGYVAPEVIQDSGYDERADVWSVGVILYILLVGYPPFVGESGMTELFTKICSGSYELHEEYWSTVHCTTKALVQSLLTVNPNARLSAKQALEHDWFVMDDKQLDGGSGGGGGGGGGSSCSNDKFWRRRQYSSVNDEFHQPFFHARRTFRAAVVTVIACQRLQGVSYLENDDDPQQQQQQQQQEQQEQQEEEQDEDRLWQANHHEEQEDDHDDDGNRLQTFTSLPWDYISSCANSLFAAAVLHCFGWTTNWMKNAQYYAWNNTTTATATATTTTKPSRRTTTDENHDMDMYVTDHFTENDFIELV